MDLDLMVIVPRELPSRAASLTSALAGTAIQVVVDRRFGERRRAHQPPAVERRQADRRAPTRVVAYVYACPVVAVGTRQPPGARGNALRTTGRLNAGFEGISLGFYRQTSGESLAG
jgi:hypothetical protein